jgi:hypothetical protein
MVHFMHPTAGRFNDLGASETWHDPCYLRTARACRREPSRVEDSRCSGRAVVALLVGFAASLWFALAEREARKQADVSANAARAEMTRADVEARHAAPQVEEVARECRRLFGADHPDTLEAVHRLALLRQKQGRAGEAIPPEAEALAGARRTKGDRDVITRRLASEILRTVRFVPRYVRGHGRRNTGLIRVKIPW